MRLALARPYLAGLPLRDIINLPNIAYTRTLCAMIFIKEVEKIKWFTLSEFSKMYQDDPNNFLGSMDEYVKLFN